MDQGESLNPSIRSFWLWEEETAKNIQRPILASSKKMHLEMWVGAESANSAGSNFP